MNWKEKDAVLDKAIDKKIFALDTETTGLNVRDGRDSILGISIAVPGNAGGIYASYYPINHRGTDGNYDPDNIGEELREKLYGCILTANCIVFHNSKFDLFALRTVGIEYTGQFVDTMLLAHLIDENSPPTKSLDACCLKYLGAYGKDKSEVLDAVIKHFGWANVPAAMMDKYAETDAKVTWQLYEALLKKVDFT